MEGNYWNKGIPEGPYCYTFLQELPDGKGYKIKVCPHYRATRDIDGWCHLIDQEIVDQVKECSINELGGN